MTYDLVCGGTIGTACTKDDASKCNDQFKYVCADWEDANTTIDVQADVYQCQDPFNCDKKVTVKGHDYNIKCSGGGGDIGNPCTRSKDKPDGICVTDERCADWVDTATYHSSGTKCQVKDLCGKNYTNPSDKTVYNIACDGGLIGD